MPATTALGALLLFAIPHLILHATRLEHFTTIDAVTALAALTITAALPAALLTLFDPPNQVVSLRRGGALPATA